MSALKRGDVRLPAVLRGFWAAVMIAAALTVVVAWLQRRAGWPLGYWLPLQLPWFSDLTEYLPTFQLLHTARFFHASDPFAYPPVAAVWFALFYGTGHPVAAYVVFAAAALGFAVWRVALALRAEGIAWRAAVWFPLTMVVLSFPLWRLAPQGNIELVLWVLAAAGVWRYVRGRNDEAAVLWGLAAATKLYPLVLLLLFLPRGKWRAFAVGVGTFVGSSVLALWWMGPTLGVAWRGELHNVFGYQSIRAGEWTMNTVATNHSAYTLVKVAAVMSGHGLARVTLPYYAVGAALVVVLFFGRLWKMPEANQVLALTVVMVSLPTISYFHTLTHLYAPWVMLVLLAVRAEKRGVRVPGLSGTLWVFLPLFVSYTLFTFRSFWLFGGIVQALALGVLMLCALQYRFEEGVPRRGRGGEAQRALEEALPGRG